jgi:UDP-N-acetylmuramate-alanine ligase
VVRVIEEMAQPGDVVVTLGAGDIYKVGETLCERWSGEG